MRHLHKYILEKFQITKDSKLQLPNEIKIDDSDCHLIGDFAYLAAEYYRLNNDIATVKEFTSNGKADKHDWNMLMAKIIELVNKFDIYFSDKKYANYLSDEHIKRLKEIFNQFKDRSISDHSLYNNDISRNITQGFQDFLTDCKAQHIQI